MLLERPKRARSAATTDRERLPGSPNQHVVQVEFVAPTMSPFEPRVLTQAAFEVAP